MLHDKNKEIDGLNKEFQRQIQVLVEDHKKEVDVSIFFFLLLRGTVQFAVIFGFSRPREPFLSGNRYF